MADECGVNLSAKWDERLAADAPRGAADAPKLPESASEPELAPEPESELKCAPAASMHIYSTVCAVLLMADTAWQSACRSRPEIDWSFNHSLG